eukprot:m.354925 g.354925  ORF g.354925 m.354925 type:complete len:471 (+) comp17136_c0_seq1:67-1479(+)
MSWWTWMVALLAIAAIGTVESAVPRREDGAWARAANYSVTDWMGALRPAIDHMTLQDLALPGSHDSMTGDLSTTIADGSNDIPPALAWVLHEFHELEPGNFIRNQSKTQGLNMTEMLETGLRFIDFRIMYSAGPDASSTAPYDWYCLHFAESNHKAMVYLQNAKDWMEKHPNEVLVLWFSRHGNICATGNDQYPNVSPATKQAFWKQVTALFGPLLFDAGKNTLNGTTYSELISSGQRVVIFASDYAEFTANSTLSLDGCKIDNKLGDDVTNEPSTLPNMIQAFATANETIAQDSKEGRYYLQSMAAGAPVEQIWYAAVLTYAPHLAPNASRECAALFNIPNMTDWCPMTLQDISLLINFYNQVALDAVITQDLHLPNAMYIDAVDVDGTIRTGTQVFSPEAPQEHGATRYAYVDTFALYTLRKACKTLSPKPSVCHDMDLVLQERRAKYPLTRWSDVAHGRHTDWPPLP